MKRGSNVLQCECNTHSRNTHTPNIHTPNAHTTNAHIPNTHAPLEVSNADSRTLTHTAQNTHRNEHAVTHTASQRACTGSVCGAHSARSGLPAATALYSPDVGTKMASHLLIRLSEATQKAQVKPGTRVELEPQGEGLAAGQMEQQEEPGLALSPDSPGASPEPPTLTHTPTHTLTCTHTRTHSANNNAAETVASELLRKLAATTEAARKREQQYVDSYRGRQEVSCKGVKVKQEEEAEPVDIGPVLVGNGPITGETSPSAAKMARRSFLDMKQEAEDDLSGAKMADQRLSGAKMAERMVFPVKTEEVLLHSGGGAGSKVEEQLLSGAKMAEQCLRAVLWQDMSVNLASTLLHQLSERASRSSGRLIDSTAPPGRTSNSPVLKPEVPSSPTEPESTTVHENNPISSGTRGYTFFYRCHVCGFETEGRGLFQGHMTEHRQWEHSSFSLHCCACEHSTNQEAEMRAHTNTHTPGEAGVTGEIRCPIDPPSSSAVAMATQREEESAEHRCRICQGSFPGQRELLLHFQGHRRGNQYHCDRCGHLTRTANKLVEHVRVHTGERPFTCDLCPYSAKRRDSLRLHRRVKHGAHGGPPGSGAPPGAGGLPGACGGVHTHRSYAHAKNVQRLHVHPDAASSSSSSSTLLLPPSLSRVEGWKELSPLLSITTLVSLRRHAASTAPLLSSSSSSSPPPSSSSPALLSSSSSSPPPSSSSPKHSFLRYLGLTGNS